MSVAGRKGHGRPVSQPTPYADTEWQPRKVASRASSVRLGSLPANSGQDVRFVQERLALFGKVTFFISSMFLVVTMSADLIRGVHRMSALGRTSHIVGTVIALALWLCLRGRRNYSPAMLQSIDIAGTLGICVSFVAMGHHSLQPYGFYTGLLSVTHVSITRAMIVPSVPLRTLLLGILSFGGFILSRATLPLSLEMAHMPASRARQILEAFLWSTAGSAVATVASKVIYGLHEKVLEARQLGQYALEEKIGEGGMGEIYRARHAMLRRPTAVKLLTGNGSEAQLRRFEKEVQLTARLTHPNTISIYDYGRTPDGVFYYAMELLEGMTLEELVQRHGPQSPGRVIHLILQVCGALKEAHRVGLIHRDIKPANIYLCQRGDIPDFVKVLDFGLVRELGAEAEITQSNVDAVVGTPLYLSPEAILKPSEIDARADIYGLGAVAYFLATGTTPFTGQSMVEVCGHHLHTEAQPPSQRHPLPEDLERVILSCLTKNPDDRPQTAQKLAQALERCRDARAWNEAEAETWWASATQAEVPAPAPAPSGEQRRTFCQIDIEERLGTKASRA
jgi:eukaryotic-like serine/threonine-protein kinase